MISDDGDDLKTDLFQIFEKLAQLCPLFLPPGANDHFLELTSLLYYTITTAFNCLTRSLIIEEIPHNWKSLIINRG